MGRIILREPAPGELPLLRRWWSDGYDPKAVTMHAPNTPGGSERDDLYMRVGRFGTTGLSPRLWFRAHELVIDELLRERVVVATLSKVDAPIGFACWSPATSDGAPPTLHFVFVRSATDSSRSELCRGRGIGSGLVDHVYRACGGVPLRYSHMTRAGLRLLAAWASITAAAQEVTDG